MPTSSNIYIDEMIVSLVLICKVANMQTTQTLNRIPAILASIFSC